jgi:pimeloyl-ACP methyl ester carboxylesterase
MPIFNSNGVSIAYEIHGNGQPIVLLHGLTVSFATNFMLSNWVEWLTGHGFQVIGMDLRGHGGSTKLYHPDDYGFAAMGGDVVNLLDHLNLSPVDLHGYSLGGFIALDLALNHPQRFRKIVCGGIGDGAIGAGAHVQTIEHIATALEAPSLAAVTNLVTARYRTFAENIPGNDVRALAAVARGDYTPKTRAHVAQLARPLLIVVGAQDEVVGSADELAKAMPQTQLVTIPTANHFTTVGNQQYKDAVVKFLMADGM